MPKTFLVPIDRDSVRENPNAGNTRAQLQGKKRRTVQVTGLLKPNPPKGTVLLSKTITENGGVWTFCVDDDSVAIESWAGLNFRVIDEREVQTMHHLPEPAYYYDHLPTDVECSSCGESFDYKELDEDIGIDYEDGSEYLIGNICPKCGTVECCQYFFEKFDASMAAQSSTD